VSTGHELEKLTVDIVGAAFLLRHKVGQRELVVVLKVFGPLALQSTIFF
jgi:hypothetical protein